MEVFISYQNASREIAYDYVKFLEENGINCWIAPRNVDVSYAGDIVEAISKCRVFALFLTQEAISSVHILNEIEQAYSYLKTGKVIILPVFLEDVKLVKDYAYYLSRIQHIPAFSIGNDAAKKELLSKIKKHLEGNTENNETVSIDTPYAESKVTTFNTNYSENDEVRLCNRYYDVDDKYEKRRLKTEAEMLLEYEKGCVDNLLKDKENVNGLILCCMYAKGIMSKYGDFSKFKNIIGLCYNEKATFEANYDYKNDKCIFYTQDVEYPDFVENLENFMEERGIEKFDFIDITMGFLDWRSPFKVIKNLKQFMAPDCRVFVRDIDDRVTFAYPDEKELFKKFKTFYPIDPLSGYRQSGRRIFSCFKKIGAKSIKLVYKGIDTCDMDYNQKTKLFHSYFGFIPNDFRISYNADPTKKEYKQIIDWCDEHYDELEEEFMNDDFFYNSGYFIYEIKM